MTSERGDLDPSDWTAFRSAAHELLDACIDRLAQAADHPWQPVPDAVQTFYKLDPAAPGHRDPAILAADLRDAMLPYGTGNTHPRFFGWVHGTGLAEGVMSEMVAATINANCGGRDHGMIYVERAVVDWSRQIMGFPDSASGVLVSGTSQATVVALAAARTRALGPEFRETGQQGRWLTAYAGAGAHNAMRKAIELMGIGHVNLRRVAEDERGMNIAELRRSIAADRAAGALPFAIVATAGSVDFGRFDDLNAVADVAASESLWMHVDGAFGAWSRLADEPWRGLSDGIGRADSMACDFHKWMFVPYDCGLVLIRHEDEHRAAFAARPSYLAGADSGLAGGDPWFCDYGIDLSRGNRALKVWSAIRMHGAQGLGAAITGNCQAAAHMAGLVTRAFPMRMVSPVVSNVCLFTANSTISPEAQSAMNSAIAKRLQLDGSVVFSTTLAGGTTCLRAAITNHRTRLDDVEVAIAAVSRAAVDLSSD